VADPRELRVQRVFELSVARHGFRPKKKRLDSYSNDP
jgi:hypothetical protein